MAIRRTNKGVTIDMDALIAASNSQTPAVGNMSVNAKGDVLGAGGQIVKKNEERVREYYRSNPKSSTSRKSLKGESPSKLAPDNQEPAPMQEPKTAKTAKENKRTKKQDTPPPPPPVQEPEEFDAPDVEPMGYREVEQPNGDIEMVPYYRSEDAE